MAAGIKPKRKEEVIIEEPVSVSTEKFEIDFCKWCFSYYNFQKVMKIILRQRRLAPERSTGQGLGNRPRQPRWFGTSLGWREEYSWNTFELQVVRDKHAFLPATINLQLLLRSAPLTVRILSHRTKILCSLWFFKWKWVDLIYGIMEPCLLCDAFR